MKNHHIDTERIFSTRNPRRELLCVSVVILASFVFNRVTAQPPPETFKGYLGIYAKSNRDVIQQKNAFEGITVTRVVENSPGEIAGAKEGDILLKANELDLTDPNQLYDLAETLPIGSNVHLRLERDKEVLELDAKTVERHALHGKEKEKEPKNLIENRRLGFEFKIPDPAISLRLGLKPREGIEVVRLAKESPLVQAGIEKRCVIAEADGQLIHSPEAFLQYLAAHSDLKTIKLKFAGEEGRWRTARVTLHQPAKTVSKLSIPPIFSYSREPRKTTFSILFGFFKREHLERGTKYRFLWVIPFETGASDELLNVEPV